VADNAAVLLFDTGQKSGHIDKRQQRDVEGVAESNEAGNFAGGVDVQGPSDYAGLIGHDSYCAPLDTAEADHRIRRKSGLDFEEVLMIEQWSEHSTNVVGDFRFCRH